MPDAVATETREAEAKARGGSKPLNRRAGESSQRIDEEEEGGYEGDDIVADDDDYE